MRNEEYLLIAHQAKEQNKSIRAYCKEIGIPPNRVYWAISRSRKLNNIGDIEVIKVTDDKKEVEKKDDNGVLTLRFNKFDCEIKYHNRQELLDLIEVMSNV